MAYYRIYSYSPSALILLKRAEEPVPCSAFWVDGLERKGEAERSMNVIESTQREKQTKEGKNGEGGGRVSSGFCVTQCGS